MNTQSIHKQQAAWTVLAAAVFCLVLAPAATAQDVANVRAGSAGIDFQPLVEHGGVVLTVNGPEGFHHRAEFGAGESPAFSIFDHAGGALPDGSYTWELTVAPTDVQRREALEANQLATRSGTPNGIERLVQSGSFAVVDGAVVAGGETEPEAEGGSSPAGGNRLATKDVVYNDDLIVTGSLCVGFDCVNGESFGFDTIRMKENNTRIKFEDTSTAAGFPTTDWQLTANDSASGGLNKFSIEDITGAKVPFTVEGGASTHSIYVGSTGRVGLRTSTPVLDLHISTTNTPGMRLEQTNAGGFTAQTWDIAGNEANFFVRDVTGGSRLPLRIRPGAPTSSIDIANTGNVGMGTTSPDANLEVESTGDTEFKVTRSTAGTGTIETAFVTTATANAAFFGTDTNDVMAFVVNAAERMRITTAGRVAIGCADPSTDFVVQSTSDGVATCATAPFSSLTAGSTNFTASSSRTIKENIVPLREETILDKISRVNVYNYDFIDGPKDRIGLMAEDFHAIFGRGPDDKIDGQDVQMALWLAVQELASENRELESEVSEKDRALGALEERLLRLEAALSVER